MVRRLVAAALAALGLMAAGEAAAQARCTAEVLEGAVDSYLKAQGRGDASVMSLASPVRYVENRKAADLATGILKSPLKIDFSRTLMDTQACETFTEVVVTDPAHPYVLGVRLKVVGGKVAEIETLVTDEGDWLFKPANTLKYASAEKWTAIPPAQRADRKTLIAAADAYLDYFDDKSVVVPWGTPCNRLEGGLYFGKGAPDDSCNVGVPANIKLTDRHYVVDEEIGAVVAILNFGPSGLPDSHLFRVENGKIRYIHTITVCPTPNCGFPTPPQLAAQN
jgi:hypothetical protein